MGEALTDGDQFPVGSLVCPEPTERPDLWPWSAVRDSEGVLSIGGVRVSDIAENFTTPVYVVDRADVRERARMWAHVMAEEFWEGYGMNGGDAFYAGKAFLCADVIREVTAVGMGVDTASLGELTCALRAGIPPQNIGLHGNNKTDEEIRAALSAGNLSGIERIFIDSLHEVEQVERIASELHVKARVMVRVKTGVHAGGNEYISTGHEDQKFGVGIADGQLDAVIEAIQASSHIELRGLHSHIGSQIYGAEAFVEAARIMCALTAQVSKRVGYPLPELDCGGGVAIAYSGHDACAPSVAEVVRALAMAIRDECARHDIPVPRVSVEPGRSVIGPTTVSVYRVGATKDATIDDSGAVRRYVAVDGGMSDNIRPALYGARYTATLGQRVSDAPLVRSRVVGKHCESGDVIVWDVDLPADVRAGDLLVVPVTGAYGYSMASNYNMMTKPGVLGVESGHAQWMIFPQTLDHMLSLDASM
ncbi:MULTISPECIES: diaminopimelate decarboxylase [unclassified Schaalia]|uniref:diaminopimelate decarboxylase n=1 Tax=unclassified Schaalia TaxID=2691889 RepID=UPI001E32AE7B|nr:MULTISPECIES: diaminopimelate decarboxylase [unclassified Schaalia]MCD4549663.1 diaminopimelate decarboxylase [Schaalia sp. lx-260]MCD4556726.1 diaminopimelate decarboxylase [Schaalia sp. lx-100]